MSSSNGTDTVAKRRLIYLAFKYVFENPIIMVLLTILGIVFGGVFAGDVHDKIVAMFNDYVATCNSLATDPDDKNRGSDIGIAQRDMRLEALDACKRATEINLDGAVKARILHQYARSLEVAHELEKAEKIYRGLASSGYIASEARLGNMLSTSPNNISEGIFYLRKASDAGSSVAKFRLGRLYIDGNWVESNFMKGWNLIKEAASLGNTQANIFVQSCPHCEDLQDDEARRFAKLKRNAP